MMKLVMFLAFLVLVAACAAPAPSSAPHVPSAPVPSAPVSTPPSAPVETPSAVPTISEEDCLENCSSICDEDADNACSQATDYDSCVADCGTIVRPAGCKGGCATGVPVECGIIFRNECSKDCQKKCAAQ